MSMERIISTTHENYKSESFQAYYDGMLRSIDVKVLAMRYFADNWRMKVYPESHFISRTI